MRWREGEFSGLQDGSKVHGGKGGGMRPLKWRDKGAETPTLRILPYFYGNSALNTEYGNEGYLDGERSYKEN